MSGPRNEQDLRRSIRRYMYLGIATVFLFIFGLGGVAMTTNIAGAVIGMGTVIVDSNVKRIQHPTGGVVGAILVRESDRVKKGDVLVRLDETTTRASLMIVSQSIDEFVARTARLEAERDGLEDVTFPESLTNRSSDEAVKRLMDGERSLFKFRREVRLGQQSQLRKRIGQLADEVDGLRQQYDAKVKESELIEADLVYVRKLFEDKLVSRDRLFALERAAVEVKGAIGQLKASIASAQGRSSEIELQILSIDQDLRSEVAEQLREASAKLAEFTERQRVAEDQLRRIELKAPNDGIVHELKIHTEGGVIQPGEVVMSIVPITDELTIVAQIHPQDIDQMHQGQQAGVRLSAFSHGTTPELTGTLRNVSPDLTVDQRTGIGYYSAYVVLPKEELAKLDEGLVLTPGMPAEVFFKTRDRTMLSYLVKPLMDQINRAFREG
ncbi:MAG TPA: HlyD family type I secretion periplasmic adaptor subunit [Rhizobiaceae bacterium]|nr:HlyD family type I secretion periplasmic adaptor subunit [Rhizobiaceae bacterium]